MSRPSRPRSGPGRSIGPSSPSQGSGLPEWIRFRMNQKPAVIATPPRKTSVALRRMPGGMTRGTPTAIAATPPAIVSFVPSARPIARPATSSAPIGSSPRRGGPPEWKVRAAAVAPLACAAALIRIAAAASSSATGAMSLAGVPASRGTIGPVSSDQRDRDQRQRGDPVGPADAPGRQQGDAEPAEVDQRREQVAVQQRDPRRVQQLGVLGVEPVEVERVGEVQPPERALLGDPRRERPVVPEGVEGEHPPGPDVLEAGRPVGGQERGDRRARSPSAGAGPEGREATAGVVSAGRGTPSQTPAPAAIEAPTSTAGSNNPIAPSSWNRSVRAERPSTASARRAGAPSQPGSSLPRIRTATQAHRHGDRGEAEDACQVAAEAQDISLAVEMRNRPGRARRRARRRRSGRPRAAARRPGRGPSTRPPPARGPGCAGQGR